MTTGLISDELKIRSNPTLSCAELYKFKETAFNKYIEGVRVREKYVSVNVTVSVHSDLLQSSHSIIHAYSHLPHLSLH